MRSIIYASIVFGLLTGFMIEPALAYDTGRYEETLSKLYPQDAPINSRYNMVFSSGDGSAQSFVVNSYDGQNIVKQHYKFTTEVNPDRVGMDLPLNGAPDSNNNIIGYFYDRVVSQHMAAGVNNAAGKTINNIYADFIGIGIDGFNGDVYGAAIYNNGTIASVTGDFIGNYIINSNAAHGAAIMNHNSTSTIGNMVDNTGGVMGNFVGNRVKVDAVGKAAYSGALYSRGSISKIYGDFIKNTASASQGNTFGGAVYFSDTAKVNEMNGNFIDNHAYNSSMSTGHFAIGGAIANYSKDGIKYLKGEFSGNTAESTQNATARGGAIYNTGVIGNIDASFIANAATANLNYARGGAIVNNSSSTNDAKIGKITGDFYGNIVSSKGSTAYGGAISHGGARAFIAGIKGNFELNKASSAGHNAYGAAIYIDGSTAKIGYLDGNFVGNSANASREAFGGAVYSTGQIDDDSKLGIKGNFSNNNAESSTRNAYGGAIFNNTVAAYIVNIAGDFIENKVSAVTAAFGGAIANNNQARIAVEAGTGLVGDFIDNVAKSSGGNALGGAIYNTGTIGDRNVAGNKGIMGSYIGNSAVSTVSSGSYRALGGAIYSNNDLYLTSDGAEYQFSGNFTEDRFGKVYNAIYFATSATNNPVLALKVENDGAYVFDDNIIGATQSGANLSFTANNQFNIEITGDSTGEVAFNNDVINAGNVSVKNAGLTLGSSDVNGSKTNGLFKPNLDNTGNAVTNLTLENAHLNLDYDVYQNLVLKDFTSDAASYLSFGANFAEGNSDKITVQGIATGSINLRTIDITGDLKAGDSVVLFDRGYVDIANLNDFLFIRDGKEYGFAYDKGVLSIASINGVTYPIYINSGGGSVQDTTFDAVSGIGVIVNDGEAVISNNIFTNNSNSGNSYDATGNGGAINNRVTGNMEIINSNFEKNSSDGLGGAIYNEGTLKVTAKDYDVEFTDNKDSVKANDIYMKAGSDLHLYAVNDGTISFNSGINGDGPYSIHVGGDNSGNVYLNSLVENAQLVSVSNSVLNIKQEDYLSDVDLRLERGTVNIANGIMGDFNINSISSNMGMLQIDVDPVTHMADMINISGNVNGTTRLILNVLSEDEPMSLIKFASAPNATDASKDSFKVSRVIGSPFSWKTSFDAAMKEWYVGLGVEDEVNPEIMAYLGLQSAGLEQTRNLFSVLKREVLTNKNCERYSGTDYCRDTTRNGWVSQNFYSSKVRNPVSLDADIWGIEAGFDMQRDNHNRLGIFTSYRKGDYDLNGNGKHYFSITSSSIDIDSYLGGLYYVYDSNRTWVLATAFGGAQKADLKTEDGIRANTTGIQLGANVEVGKKYALDDTLTFKPSVALGYNYLNYDRITDTVGTNIQFDTIKQTTLEFGMGLEKVWNIDCAYVMAYIRPGILYSHTGGDEVHIANLPNTGTYHDQVLGKLEIGGKVQLYGNLDTYGFASQTFGNKYSAGEIGLGLSYNW